MRAEPLAIDFLAEIEKHQAQRAQHRSAGLHLSTVIKRIVRQLEPKRFGDAPIDPALTQTGFIWEDVLSEAFGQQFGGRQMEIERDGIFMTLDGFNTQEWRPREFKATKISAANPITSNRFWHWKVQVGCYAAAADAEEVELYPLHLNGSYEMGGGRFGEPVVKPVLLRFTRRELQEFWEMVLREAERMDREDSRGRGPIR